MRFTVLRILYSTSYTWIFLRVLLPNRLSGFPKISATNLVTIRCKKGDVPLTHTSRYWEERRLCEVNWSRDPFQIYNALKPRPPSFIIFRFIFDSSSYKYSKKRTTFLLYIMFSYNLYIISCPISLLVTTVTNKCNYTYNCLEARSWYNIYCVYNSTCQHYRPGI